MKVMNDVRAQLQRERSRLQAKLDEIHAEIYKIDAVLQATDRTAGLKRIRRLSYPMVCLNCKEQFTGHQRNQAAYCQKPECVRAHNRARRKGVTLVEGEKK